MRQRHKKIVCIMASQSNTLTDLFFGQQDKIREIVSVSIKRNFISCTGSKSICKYNVCGNPNCRCKDPENPKKHGPYYQISYSHKGKSMTQFVKMDAMVETQKQLKNFYLYKNERLQDYSRNL